MSVSHWLRNQWLGIPAGGGGSGSAPTAPMLAVADNANNTGAMATVTGADVGTTETLYALNVNGGFGQAGWVIVGSRSGNGNITAALAAGYYWWYVVSTNSSGASISNLVYQSITTGADGVHDQCLLAVQSRIQALTLAGIANGSVVVKKLAIDTFLGSVRAGNIGVTLPAVVVIPQPETQSASRGNNVQDDVGYAVLVILVDIDNQEPTVAANLPKYLLWRQQINRCFRQQRLPGVPSVYQTEVEPRSVVDQQAWAANYYVSALNLRFTSREPRGFGA